MVDVTASVARAGSVITASHEAACEQAGNLWGRWQRATHVQTAALSSEHHTGNHGIAVNLGLDALTIRSSMSASFTSVQFCAQAAQVDIGCTSAAIRKLRVTARYQTTNTKAREHVIDACVPCLQIRLYDWRWHILVEVTVLRLVWSRTQLNRTLPLRGCVHCRIVINMVMSRIVCFDPGIMMSVDTLRVHSCRHE